MFAEYPAYHICTVTFCAATLWHHFPGISWIDYHSQSRVPGWIAPEPLICQVLILPMAVTWGGGMNPKLHGTHENMKDKFGKNNYKHHPRPQRHYDSSHEVGLVPPAQLHITKRKPYLIKKIISFLRISEDSKPEDYYKLIAQSYPRIYCSVVNLLQIMDGGCQWQEFAASAVKQKSAASASNLQVQ